MRPAPFLAALVLLALAACDEDPARLADGPRYVWVSQEATVIPADHSNGEITAPGYAYARMALELTYTGPYTWLFTDSTMRDTIGLASPSQLSATTPSGDSIRPGTPGSPALVVALSKRKAGVLAARRAELAARAAGTQTRVGYPACTSLRSLESWMAGSARDDASTTDSLQERGECVRLSSGVPATILDTAAAGRARVRVYAEEEPVEVWTQTGAVGAPP